VEVGDATEAACNKNSQQVMVSEALE
jgi:hypothetical protein